MSAEGGVNVPDLILERYRLAELPVEEMDRIARLLERDPQLSERLRALDESDAEIARQYSPGALAARVRERSRGRARSEHTASSRARRVAVALAFAATALVLAVLLPRALPAFRSDGDRIKGLRPSLAVYRRTTDGSETLANGAVARTGDLLLLAYVSAGRGYGVILSIDGRGVVTLHLPPEGVRAAALRGGGTVLLDHAYELDDAPAWERFYFVTADRAFDVGPIMDAARRAAARDLRSPPDTLPISREFGQSTFSVQKEVKP